MKNLFSILFLLGLFSCKKSEPTYPRLIPEAAKVILKANPKIMVASAAPVLQMNFDSTATVFESPYDWDNDKLKKTYYPHPDKDSVIVPHGLRIIIDTTYRFHTKGFSTRETIFPDQDSIDLLRKSAKEGADIIGNYFASTKYDKHNFYECYPVLLFNSSDQDMYIFTDENFRFIQEALDTDGKWKPIEYWDPTPSCIPTGWYLAIRPNNYAASAVLKYHGNFKTKIRIRFETEAGIYFSNAITGFINRSQFDQLVLERNPWVQQTKQIKDKAFREEIYRSKLNFLILNREDWQRRRK